MKRRIFQAIVATIALSAVVEIAVSDAKLPPRGRDFSCDPCKVFRGQPLKVSIPDDPVAWYGVPYGVEYRLRATNPGPSEGPDDTVYMDWTAPYESDFPTFELKTIPARYYVRAAVWLNESRRELYGWRYVYVDPVPVVPRFRVRPLVVAGTQEVVGLKLYNVPRKGVRVVVDARGFKQTSRLPNARGRIDLKLTNVRGEKRTYRIPGSLTIGSDGLARLEVAVTTRGEPKRKGVLVRDRSTSIILRRNRKGDTRVHQAPNGFECWDEYPARRVSCKFI
jgi:hypothetical protein